MSTIDLTPAEQAGTDHAATAPIPEDLLVKVLEPYAYKGCRYLIDAGYKATENSVLAYGHFSIPESAYIRSTGHFNAVELLLCFNQLAYSAFAPAVLNEEIPVLVGWSIDDYFSYQLPSMLIKTASSRFRRPINAHDFSARLLCKDFEVIERSQRYLKVPCAIEFWDDDGGAAGGEVELAVLNIP
ncbi:FcoT family thioesterase [Candidatus Mycolicibacterium alkanivorans]|uniref:(2E)-enoyl-[ACP] glycyltransferase n=1 Tax=Candidatus Mycolicibacterium alkanivorans TaxID=2954114 RepID=A0ABS9YZY4_9MYCO|nr:FcoT family thioesterase [Candidatus Mycolicibacterium alkanivorans]MCI4676643.1 FcoT family thioesterase [Candidatus Mycolicibacterium alkanivorans]